jgi:hypothetical protein
MPWWPLNSSDLAFNFNEVIGRNMMYFLAPDGWLRSGPSQLTSTKAFFPIADVVWVCFC